MGPTVTSTDRLCHARHVVSIVQGSHAVLLDTQECRYHTLNEVGARVWQLLSDGPDLSALVATVCAEFDARSDRVENDVVALIADLRSRGLVRVERRTLPVIDGGRASALPPLYATWIEQVLDGSLPDEHHATCQDCAMAQPVGQAATVNSTRFDPQVKCCTYLPVLPNYLVGQILSDTSESGAIGRQSVRERLSGASVASPLGIGMSRDYAAIYKHAGPLFGRSEALRCPHFVETNGGACGIWRHRNSVCATYFCKFGRGAIGKAFWDALLELLGLVERYVAIWCVRELDLDVNALDVAMLRNGTSLPSWAGDNGGDWGAWRGREEQFYMETADLARRLSWGQVVDLGGVDIRASIKKVQQAHATHARTEVPEPLRLAPVSMLQAGSLGTVISGYSLYDMLRVPTALANALDHFNGRRANSEVLKIISAETGESIDANTLGRLVDFRVLVPLPDLGATDLGASVRDLVTRTPAD
jgi:hypothetical protein